MIVTHLPGGYFIETPAVLPGPLLGGVVAAAARLRAARWVARQLGAEPVSGDPGAVREALEWAGAAAGLDHDALRLALDEALDVPPAAGSLSVEHVRA